LLGCSLELVRLKLGGEIEQRAGHGGDWDAGVDGALVLGQRRPVRADPSLSAKFSLDSHIHDLPGRLADAEQRSGRPVTQPGARTARQHRGHPHAVARDPSPANRIHASVHDVKPLRLHPPIDRSGTEAELQQLPPRNHTVLPIGELSDRSLASRGTSTRHIGVDVPFDFLTGGSRRVNCSLRARYVAVT
jgi:hypothetical protein